MFGPVDRGAAGQPHTIERNWIAVDEGGKEAIAGAVHQVAGLAGLHGRLAPADAGGHAWTALHEPHQPVPRLRLVHLPRLAAGDHDRSSRAGGSTGSISSPSSQVESLHSTPSR